MTTTEHDIDDLATSILSRVKLLTEEERLLWFRETYRLTKERLGRSS